MKIVVAGAGAFGAAVAVALSETDNITLLGRNPEQMQKIADTRAHESRLPGIRLPTTILATAESTVLNDAGIVLLCIPTQKLSAYLEQHSQNLAGKRIVACCKGIDLDTLKGPVELISAKINDAVPAILSGPSFAADIARGLPTALTLACADKAAGEELQQALTRTNLRLYASTDVAGAQLGGALKNVIAIAAGVTLGAGLGESARAALIARGFSEMQRLAAVLGAQAETLMGLSGMGDLILTCSSEQSRNFSYGLALGSGKDFDSGLTVEGAATAKATVRIASSLGLELPIASAVDDLVEGRTDVQTALRSLLSRPANTE